MKKTVVLFGAVILSLVQVDVFADARWFHATPNPACVPGENLCYRAPTRIVRIDTEYDCAGAIPVYRRIERRYRMMIDDETIPESVRDSAGTWVDHWHH